MNPKVSIIVPVYNTSHYLRQCLISLKNQTLKDIEVIIVDDGSTDASPSICDEFNNVSTFSIFHNQNNGVSEARNFGIEKAKGKYLMFVDSDDWLEPDACKNLYLAAEDENVDLVICAHYNESTLNSSIRYMYNSNKKFTDENNHIYTQQIKLNTLGLTGNYLNNPAFLDRNTPVWARLYKTEIIKQNKIQFIPLFLLPSECLQFNFEYVLKASTAYYLNIPLYHYRRNTSQSVTKPYRDDLLKKWLWWNEMITTNFFPEFDQKTKDAFYSRLSCSVIPLGGNALKLQKYSQIREECKLFLQSAMLEEAFKNFNYSSCLPHWKVFFYSAKSKKVDLFIALTWCMRRILDFRKK